MTMTTDPAERTQITTEWLLDHLEDVSPPGIASAIGRLIKSGTIAQGSQLPTVRALATRLGVSPATVSAAWNILRKQRVIDGSGRQGTWVLGSPTHLVPARFENIRQFWSGGVLDLTLAAPDPRLLPDLMEAVRNAAPDPSLNLYNRPNITDKLREAVSAAWPWEPESWLAVNGGYEGLLLLLSSCIVPGDYVAVADPSAPRILDILEHVGARAIPVETDGDGPLPHKLKLALQKRPIAFIYEPRASSRLGISVGPERRDQLGKVLAGSDVLIIEDEGLGDLAVHPYCGQGPLFPDRTALIRSYSKSHGPDLRLAVIGGAADLVTRARDIRQFGAGWSSRLMQNALAWMLTDEGSRAQLQAAKEKYAQRRELMAGLLAERGVQVINRDGLCLAVPVLNEQQALMVLASHGIAALGGSESAIRSHPPTIRLSIGTEFSDPELIAEAYSMAARVL